MFTELAFAGIDVAFGVLNLTLSTARFAIAAAVVVHEVGQATIKAGAATRSVVQDWVDDLVAKSECTAIIPVVNAAIDAVAVTVFPAAPLALAPAHCAGYLPAAVDEAVAVACEVVTTAPRKTAALKALVAAERRNFCELLAVTAELVATKEADLAAQYNAMSIRELKAAARGKVKNYSRMTRKQLIAALTA